MSFDIKFTRQGFGTLVSRAIQHAFSKPSLVNVISKDVNLVIYKTSDYDVIFDFFVDSASLAT